MDQLVTGTIHGNTIVLDAPASMPEGQAVEVIIRPASPAKGPWGEGIRASAGGWAGYPEMEAVMERIHQERKVDRPSGFSP